MSEVTQTLFAGDPSGIPGNCVQAAVASLLDLPLDQVPHFAAFQEWHSYLAAWATTRGFHVVQHAPQEYVEAGIAHGTSPRGVGHTVVWRGGRIAWDPHPSRAGLLEVERIDEFAPGGPGVPGFLARVDLAGEQIAEIVKHPFRYPAPDPIAQAWTDHALYHLLGLTSCDLHALTVSQRPLLLSLLLAG